MTNSHDSEKKIPDHDGILTEDYARERLKKPAHIFRLKVRAAMVSRLIRERLKSPDNLNIVDLGAAEGLTMLEMQNYLPSSDITGVEFSKELIKSAPSFPDNLRLLQGDVTVLKDLLPPGKADVVSALAILEHLQSPDKAIEGAHYLLKDGGTFVATCPNPFWDKVACFFGLLKDGDHETDMTAQVMSDLLKKHGFKDVKFEKFMWAPTSFLPYLHIPISTEQSMRADSLFQNVPLANLLFVNQVIVGTR